jgi:integrase
MLTVKAVEAAKPREKGYKMTDGQGLYLFVSPAGGKSWRANFMVDGKQKTRTYGMWPALGLPDARKAHAAAREGPAQAKIAPTFREVAREWLLIKKPSLSNAKHALQVENTLKTYAFPKIGSKPMNAIVRRDLVDVVSGAQEDGKIETAHRVAGRVTAVFDYALDAGILESHPASNLTRVLAARKVKKPMASIPPDEACDLLRAIEQYPDLVTRLALQFMALTFVRVGELRGMVWAELREDGAIWVIPEERMKAGILHVVPLSKQAQKILKQMREINGDTALVFDSPARPGHPLSENTMLFALYNLGYRGRMTVHGFRALASTVLNERSGFPHDVIERQLAHKETDAVRAAYNRAEYLDARRKLMAWWGSWIERTASGR